jgi:uncharacterized protein
MQLPSDAERLSIYIGEEDEFEGQPLYEALVEEAHTRGLAGATVYRGVCGFGAGSRIHTTSILRLAEDMPLVVEIVDRSEKINGFLPVVDHMVGEGLATVEPVRVIFYRHGDR